MWNKSSRFRKCSIWRASLARTVLVYQRNAEHVAHLWLLKQSGGERVCLWPRRWPRLTRGTGVVRRKQWGCQLDSNWGLIKLSTSARRWGEHEGEANPRGLFSETLSKAVFVTKYHDAFVEVMKCFAVWAWVVPKNKLLRKPTRQFCCLNERVSGARTDKVDKNSKGNANKGGCHRATIVLKTILLQFYAYWQKRFSEKKTLSSRDSCQKG